MSYRVHLDGRSFHIKKESIPAVLVALENVPVPWSNQTVAKVRRHAADWKDRAPWWQLHMLLFECWGLGVVFDSEDNIKAVDLVVDVFLRDEVLYALAPFVWDGDHLDFHDEDGNHWRYVFAAGKCRRQQAKVVWED